MKPEECTIARIMKIEPNAMDPSDGVIVDQIVKIKTENDLVFEIFDHYVGLGRKFVNVTKDMIGEKKRLIIKTNFEEEMQRAGNEKTRVLNIIPREPGVLTDRLVVVAEVKQKFEYNTGYYEDIIIDAGFGSIWLSVDRNEHNILQVGDIIKFETGNIHLEEVLDGDNSKASNAGSTNTAD